VLLRGSNVGEMQNPLNDIMRNSEFAQFGREASGRKACHPYQRGPFVLKYPTTARAEILT
jgi:hypothetical protein